MSDAILRLSSMQFEDPTDLMAAGPVLEGDIIEGGGSLPLVAYEMMLPMLETSEDDALPILFSIDRDEAPALRIAG